MSSRFAQKQRASCAPTRKLMTTPTFNEPCLILQTMRRPSELLEKNNEGKDDSPAQQRSEEIVQTNKEEDGWQGSTHCPRQLRSLHHRVAELTTFQNRTAVSLRSGNAVVCLFRLLRAVCFPPLSCRIPFVN